MFKQGDIVVTKYSKAQTLKPKVFKIISVVPNGNTYQPLYRVINAYGKQKDMREWRLRLLSDEIDLAHSRIATARAEVTRRENELFKIRREEKEVSKYFPIV